jgi:hypothetical protein
MRISGLVYGLFRGSNDAGRFSFLVSILVSISYHRVLRSHHDATVLSGIVSRMAGGPLRGFLAEDRSCFAAVRLLIRPVDQ